MPTESRPAPRAGRRRALPPRGLTLIEMMVAVLLTSIVLATATSLLLSVVQNRKLNQARLEVKTNSTVAVSLLEYDAMNAGYRFAAAPFAVRILQNITGAEPELLPATATANCAGQAAWGLKAGTDVVEFRRGYDVLPDAGIAMVPGPATGVSCTAAGLCNITLGNGAFSNPFSSVPADGAGAVVLFSNATNACAGIISTAGVNSAQFVAQLVKQDLVTVAGNTVYPNCPTAGMTVMRLGSRQRYLICNPPAALPFARPALYRLTYDGTNTLLATDLVQEGIEDVQVAVRVDNGAGLMSGGGCQGSGTGAFCWCNDTTGTCTNYEPNPTAAGALDSTAAAVTSRTAYLLRGLRLGVTAISTIRAADNANATLTAPALYDHPAGVAQSANLRTSTQAGLALNNIVMVVP